LDHKNLNLDIDDFKSSNPSAENIAVLIYNRLIPYFNDSFKLKITLYETPRNFVEYSG
jgi:6-pyruvoyltetrahydropterin/6-carboxytetrahydropterin synthase